MKCSYCLTDFHAESHAAQLDFLQSPKLNTLEFAEFYIFTTVCSKCFGAHIYLRTRKSGTNNNLDYRLVQPQVGGFQPAPPEAPANISADYKEANQVLGISPKASSALSRRCLQSILSAHGYVGRDLVKQIEAVLAETDASKALPTSIRENIDAIRNFGNFSAHPITDQTTLQIVEVEEGEAEWCLQLLLDLFDHFYVAPARAAERRSALSAKLAAAGKPPMKS